MVSDFNKFIGYLDKEDKEKAVDFAILLLNEKKISINELYKNFLIPAMYELSCNVKDKEICIWKEHKRTSIIRTILEISYSYIANDVLKKKSNKKKVLVFCPEKEYHEIGAIISNHYFLLMGFDSQYIGADTPNEDVLSATRVLKPDYIAISVSNYYNLVVTKKVIDLIIKNFPNIKIIIGGYAFTQSGAKEQIPHHLYFKEAEEILGMEADF